MKIKIKISLTDNKNIAFMGIGLVWLLELIKEYGSINKAAKHMNMSYTKAHKILTNLEKKLNKKLLIKEKGGIQRGGAQLTEFALKFLKEYKKMNNDIKKYSEKKFKAFVEKINKG